MGWPLFFLEIGRMEHTFDLLLHPNRLSIAVFGEYLDIPAELRLT
jgi:hypothetical protein